MKCDTVLQTPQEREILSRVLKTNDQQLCGCLEHPWKKKAGKRKHKTSCLNMLQVGCEN